jgi:hypothetical protein
MMLATRRMCGLGLGLLLISAACQVVVPHTVQGSGNIRSESRRVGDFDAVELAGIGSLIVTQGSADALTIQAEDNILPSLTEAVSGGRLRLGVAPGARLQPSRPIRFEVTVKKINGLILSGPGDVDAVGVRTNWLRLQVSDGGQATIARLIADTLSVQASGSGVATVNGSAPEQWVTITGHGDYHGENLVSRAAHVVIKGVGSCGLQVSDNLDLAIIGSGNVKYMGWPALTEHITGKADVSRVDSF